MPSTESASPAPSARKAAYRVVNWPEYDRALVARGDITFWFDAEALPRQWLAPPTGKRGAPMRYADGAIQTLLVLKPVFGLPYRAVEGLGRALLRILGLDLPVPDHTHLSRRARALSVQIVRRERAGPRHVVVDATGLKVFGEGEWKVRQHGVGTRRAWLKVHLAVDADARDVIAVEVTTTAWTDGQVLGGLMDQVEDPIAQIDADGAYDTREAYTIAARRGARLVVPPRENAVAWEPTHPRTQALAEIAQQGLAQWKRDTGYHRRSLAEHAMYRLKQLFGDRLATRRFAAQVNEVHARIAALNRMTYLGMPQSVRVGGAAS